MSDQTQRIGLALRVTPRRDRGRYEAEWRHDLGEAEAYGVSRRDVERGALRLAVNLRARQVEGYLLGRWGAAATVRAWLVLLGSFVLAGFLPFGALVVLVVLIGLLVVIARAGAPSDLSHWLMIASMVVGALSAGFVWWALGEHIHAADAMRAAPAATAWAGAALMAVLVSAATLVVSALVAVGRERRLSR